MINFYKNKKWLKKRKVILTLSDYECSECKRYGNSKLAVMVHHIMPLELFPEYKLSNDNLIALCNSCHNKLHVRNSHMLTIAGQQLIKRQLGLKKHKEYHERLLN